MLQIEVHLVVLCKVFFRICFYVKLSFGLCDIWGYYVSNVQVLGSATTYSMLCLQEI